LFKTEYRNDPISQIGAVYLCTEDKVSKSSETEAGRETRVKKIL
jgi:hypothetical protein